MQENCRSKKLNYKVKNPMEYDTKIMNKFIQKYPEAKLAIEQNSINNKFIIHTNYRSIYGVTIVQEEVTALHIAVRDANIEIVELLLAKGADISIQDNLTKSPLYYAAKANLVNIMRILSDPAKNNGQKIICPKRLYDKHENFLDIAVEQNNLENVKILLEAIEDLKPFKSLMYAKNSIMAKMILDKLESQKCQENIQENGTQLLHLALIYEYMDIVKLLIDKIDLNQPYAGIGSLDHTNYQHLLHMAIRKIEFIKLLLEKGAEPSLNAQDNENATPLYIAVDNKSYEVVSFLVNYPGINVNTCPNPLKIAVQNKDARMTCILLQNKPKTRQDLNDNKYFSLAHSNDAKELATKLLTTTTPDHDDQNTFSYSLITYLKTLLYGKKQSDCESLKAIENDIVEYIAACKLAGDGDNYSQSV